MTTVIQQINQIEDQHTSGAYPKRPLTLVRGEGCTVWDNLGNAYLDATSGMGVAILGHSHPSIVNAIIEQAQMLITCPEIFYNDRRAELYTKLSSITPKDLNRFFLCNSGAEAIEGAIKIARLLTGRIGIVAAKRAFHGRTLGALGLTWNPQYREPFEGWTPNHIAYITYNDTSSFTEVITDQTAAVVVEAVQGEGGVFPADSSFLRAVRQRCDETGALMIVDEIQSGLGRTGKWFAFQHADILPDMMALGKGIAGGLPMGVVCWRESLGTIPISSHGSTFGGNPLACAAALATLNVLMRENLVSLCAELGAWLLNELHSRNLPYIRDIRGMGLMVGLELRGRVTPVLQKLQETGILALPAGKTVLRLLPPYIIAQDELETMVNKIEITLHHVNS